MIVTVGHTIIYALRSQENFSFYFNLNFLFCFLYIFLVPGGGSPLYPENLQYYTMILQRIRIIVVDAGFEPGTSAPEVWRATNEPPPLPLKIRLPSNNINITVS